MLYFVPTPIWNKEDITLRALRLLKEVNIFFCEDTATTKKLMNMYDISLTWKQFFALTSFTDQWKLNHYVNLLKENDAVVTSEAGTPWLSDPGKNLIKMAWGNNLPFEVLPGATALIPAIVSAYTDTSTFAYFGFIPTKKWRQTILKMMIETVPYTPCFFYESVHRVEKLFDELEELGYDGTVFVAREISKMFEQKLVWTIQEMKEKIMKKELIIKWEFVIWLRKND